MRNAQLSIAGNLPMTHLGIKQLRKFLLPSCPRAGGQSANVRQGAHPVTEHLLHAKKYWGVSEETSNKPGRWKPHTMAQIPWPWLLNMLNMESALWVMNNEHVLEGNFKSSKGRFALIPTSTMFQLHSLLLLSIRWWEEINIEGPFT